MKLCKDCKHYEKADNRSSLSIYWYSSDMCRKDKRTVVDPVTGEGVVEGWSNPCRIERDPSKATVFDRIDLGPELCGREGKDFEAKA